MKRFTIIWKDTRTGESYVEATNEAEARELAERAGGPSEPFSFEILV